MSLPPASSPPPLVSLVVPVHNEAAAIATHLTLMLERAAADGHRLELIAVDDGSSDDSAREIARAAALDARIRCISFTRNFGKEAAIVAGLTEARGAAVVVLDSDLQHPPELVPRMVGFWRQGAYVVDAVKQHRGEEPLSQGLFARIFYGLFRRLAGMDLAGHADFKLLDRVVVDAYLALPERHHFFRGLIHWAGYPSVQLPFSVAPRAGGAGSRWSRLRLLRYAIDNLSSFSSLPLKLVTWLGMITLGFGAVIGAISLLQKLRGESLDGFTTVNLLIIVTSGAVLVSLGIIGHYLARLYDEIKGRPVYLLRPPARGDGPAGKPGEPPAPPG